MLRWQACCWLSFCVNVPPLEWALHSWPLSRHSGVSWDVAASERPSLSLFSGVPHPLSPLHPIPTLLCPQDLSFLDVSLCLCWHLMICFPHELTSFVRVVFRFLSHRCTPAVTGKALLTLATG